MLFSTTNKNIGIFAFCAVAFVGLLLLVSGARTVRADNPVFLTRQGGVISTYPRNVGLSVGTTTASGQVATTSIAKLNVTLNPSETFLGVLTDGFRKAFQVASTTTAGGTATSTKDIFAVYNTGCVQLTATSSATQIKLVFGTVPTTTVSGFVQWQYGTC